jgi:hypothetical protein
VVLDEITPLELLLKLIAQEQTPISCLSVWKMHKAYQRSPTATRLTFILHANTWLTTQHSIDKHTVGGLIRALKDEKKKRSCGKCLNLLGEESSRLQFYSPATVRCAKAYASEKEAGEQQERDRFAAKKALAATNKLRKAQEKTKRALQVIERRRIAVEKKLQHAADVQARKELRQAAKTPHNDRILVKKITKPAPKLRNTTKRPAGHVVVAPMEGVVS